MKIKLKIEKEFDVKSIRASFGVRHFEDAKINEITDDNDNPKMPLVEDNRWNIEVDLESGKVKNWPNGVTVDTYFKVCDDGIYELLTEENEVIASKEDCYVLDMFAINDRGYGDYVLITIDENGIIENWKADLTEFERNEED